MQSQSLRPAKAAALLGISRNTLCRWARDRADFPKPRRLSARCTVYDQAELTAWRDKQSTTYDNTLATNQA